MQQQSTFCVLFGDSTAASLRRSLLLLGEVWVSLLSHSWGHVNHAILKRCFHCVTFPRYDLWQEKQRRKNRQETMNLPYWLSLKKKHAWIQQGQSLPSLGPVELFYWFRQCWGVKGWGVVSGIQEMGWNYEQSLNASGKHLEVNRSFSNPIHLTSAHLTKPESSPWSSSLLNSVVHDPQPGYLSGTYMTWPQGLYL